MSKEVPKFIDAPTGKMFVIEHCPAVEEPVCWVISLNSGLQCRTGPRRLYVALARKLVESGIGVLRVDLPGVGDSDGPNPELHFDMHKPEHVQTVIDYVKEAHSPKAILLHGLCSGARTAIKTAAVSTDVAGVLAWSVPILTSTPGMPSPPEGAKYGVSKAAAKDSRNRIFRVFREARFLDPRFWHRHLTSGKLGAELKRAFWSAWLLMRNQAPTNNESPFLLSLSRYATSKRPIQFIYGERDTCAYHEFRDLELDLPEEDVVLLPGGTHTFSTAGQKYRAVTSASEWMMQNFVNRAASR